MTRSLLPLLSFVALLVSGCWSGSPDTAPEMPRARAGSLAAAAHLACTAKELRGLRYVKGCRRCKLDLYLPSGSPPFPVVVWLHPGGWAGGSRASVRHWAIGQTCAGRAVAAVDYRLSEIAPFPAQIADARAAVRYLRSHREELGLSDRIAAWGASAGGHLAALLATSADVARFDDGRRVNPRISPAVDAAVVWWGPVDFMHMDSDRLPQCPTKHCHDCPGSPESRLLGCTVPDCPGRARRASPLTYIEPSDPPFLVMQGTRDCTVPPHQAERLTDALTKAGVPNQLVYVQGASHGDGRWSKRWVLDDVTRFLDRTIGPTHPTKVRYSAGPSRAAAPSHR